MEDTINKTVGNNVVIQPERAVLAAVDTNRNSNWAIEDSLDELCQLVATAGATVVGRIIQKLHAPARNSYLGKGKLDELIEMKKELDYNLVIFDDELSPIQQRSLEEALGVKVIDRVALILDIFAKHANTREGQLQVELAQMQYLLPRLAGQWSHLERLGGGIGTRGPGESQLETDKRIVRTKIRNLKEHLDEVIIHRELYRERRRMRGVPVVSLVGYTNSGKSSLLNAVARTDVLAENKLFATLDPTTRRLYINGLGNVLLTDTVGFIRKLPPAIVKAFRATLEEINQADLLVHVVDITAKNAFEQCQTVEKILTDMGVADKPRLTAMNKIDLKLDTNRSWTEEEALSLLKTECPVAENTVLISAVKRWGLTELNLMLKEKLISMGFNPGYAVYDEIGEKKEQ
ncbi:GTPase HflX [Dehalococcoides mccartyi]|uniref:GTPase HflX n=1 Tax=Dehalococcoides mccartyi TaxID=61435 RepID=UPI00098FA569|nr:GTPase HflX [Dehalococcoides mccartyi]AQU05771.1 GTPase HflX [Dehalococcoides mccartyi]AQU07217.1 GTPase HflX [Dehalococcoides mccartyi]